MFKVTWGRKNDPHYKTFVLVPDAYALFETYHIIKGYGRDDGCSPINIVATNLDGHEIDMSQGIGHAASFGSCVSHG